MARSMPDPLAPAEPPSAFLPSFEAAMARLRAGLTEVFGAVGADPAAPQAVARAYGINRNLAWKLSRIVNSTDPVDAVQYVPGRSGLQIALDALGAHGAPAPVLERVRSAAEDFDRMVSEHAGSRAGLELMLGSMVPKRVDPLLLESSRKLAFQGLSAIWGVQAKTRFAAQIVMPNAQDPSRVDLGVVSGHTEFKRLRPVTRWPLQHLRAWGDIDKSYTPLDGSVPAGEAPFLGEFCTPSTPAVDLRVYGENNVYELREGPVGNTAAFTYAFGFYHRDFASIHADGDDDVAEHSVVCDTPTERLVIDLLIHRELPVDAAPRFCMCSLVHAEERFPLSRDAAYHLPSLAEVQELGPSPHLATPHVPRHHEMMGAACAALGRPLDEFRAYRLSIAYPPAPTRSVLYYPLLARP